MEDIGIDYYDRWIIYKSNLSVIKAEKLITRWKLKSLRV